MRGVRSASCSPACCSCSSWTVHSMSESPPRPSLRWVFGSAPRGSRSVVDPGLDPADLDHVVPADPVGRVAQRVDHLGEPAPEVLVAHDRVRPQQRLRLPDLRPLRVVLVVRLDRPHERALLPLGAQAGVDLQRRVATGQGEQAAQLVRDRVGVRRRLVRVGALHRVVDEHHVRVAAVGQLEAAVPAHRHDRHPARRLVEPLLLPDRAAGDLEGGLERRVGQPGQAGADVGHVDLAEQVADRDPEQLAAPDPADGTHRVLGALLAAGGGDHLAGQRLGGEWRQLLAEHPDALRLTLEEVGRVAGGGQQPGQALRRPAPRRAAC